MMKLAAYAVAAIVCCTRLACAATQRDFPVIRLKARYIDTGTEPNWGSSLRRSMAETRAAAYAFRGSAQWGMLATAEEQLLVSVQPDAQPNDVDQLLHDLEVAGAHICGYLPEHTYLVLGDGSVAALASKSTVVAWVGDHLPEYKVSHDLQKVSVLLQRFLNASSTGSGGSTASYTLEEFVAALQSEAVAAEDKDAVRRVQWEMDPSGGGIRVPLLAMFPPTTGAAAQPLSSNTTSTRDGANPAAAAVADWAQHLTDALSADVSRLSSHKVLVSVPIEYVSQALDWLSAQPPVHWISALAPIRLHNYQAAAIQSGTAAGPDVRVSDPKVFPMWAAGLTGKGQIVGMGDSGLAYDSCYFSDPAVDIDSNWKPLEDYPDVMAFIDLSHRKIVQYIAAADSRDAIGHGTHCAGSIAGQPLASDGADAALYQGMAPDAKIAFMDLSSGRSGTVITPRSLNEDYFPFAYELGARVHSNSWGSDSLEYDVSAFEVDEYTWQNKDFLPVFAAGNYGELSTAGSGSGTRTITAPATCKNCIAAGATQGEEDEEEASARSMYQVAEGQFYLQGSPHTWKLVLAAFGPSMESLYGKSMQVVPTTPIDACSTLSNAAQLKGVVALIQRGTCTFLDKAKAAEAAGAAAVILYDDKPGAYFLVGAQEGAGTVDIPVGLLPNRFGVEMTSVLGEGGQVSVTLGPVPIASGLAFDNLASFSSQGPTTDGRAKPDILAPGTTWSAAPPFSKDAEGYVGDNEQCGIGVQSGTSMATPLIAGAAALVRQYFLDGYYPKGIAGGSQGFNPSGALLKAVMMGGAKSITGIEADTGLPIDPTPGSNRQGWGRLYLPRSTPVQGMENGWRMQLVDGAELSQAGQQHTYCVRATGGPLRVTLVWWDYPSMPFADTAIVNDLDLTVTDSQGEVQLGNGGATPDRLNTVEQTIMNDMPTGVATITVEAHTTFAKAGAQPYALVVHGFFEGDLDSPANPGADPANVVPCIAVGR